MRDYYDVNPIITENKEKLTKAFKLLRKAGLIARQNFACCGSCGSYEIATHIEELLNNGKTAVGYVFYNRQGTESLYERRSNGHLYLSYADGTTNKYPNNKPVSTLDVGKLLAATLIKVGLAFEWDGTDDSCVMVKMAERAAEKIEADSETWGE